MMKLARLLIILVAFLLMVSSALTLISSIDKTPVYLNVIGMFCLIVVITLMNINKNK